MKKILWMLPHHWYIEAYIEYIIRYLGDEYDMDLAIPSDDYNREEDYPENFSNPTNSLIKNAGEYDLLISLLTGHPHVDYRQNAHKLAQVVWERGERNGYALLHASTTDETDREMEQGNIPYVSVRLGMDTELFKPFPQYKDPDVLTVGVVGRLHSPRKHIKEIFMPLLDMEGVKFDFYTSQLLQKDDITDCGGIEFYKRLKGGFKKWTGLPNMYNSMDVLVETDDGQGASLTVLEASACGTPSICLQTGWDDLGSVVVDDAKDIKRSIEMLRNYPGLRSQYSREARWSIEEKYTWEKQIPNWKRFVDEALALL